MTAEVVRLLWVGSIAAVPVAVAVWVVCAVTLQLPAALPGLSTTVRRTSRTRGNPSKARRCGLAGDLSAGVPFADAAGNPTQGWLEWIPRSRSVNRRPLFASAFLIGLVGQERPDHQ